MDSIEILRLVLTGDGKLTDKITVKCDGELTVKISNKDGDIILDFIDKEPYVTIYNIVSDSINYIRITKDGRKLVKTRMMPVEIEIKI